MTSAGTQVVGTSATSAQSHYTSIPPAATFGGFNGGGGSIGPIERLTGGAFITGVKSFGCCSIGGGGFLHSFL